MADGTRPATSPSSGTACLSGWSEFFVHQHSDSLGEEDARDNAMPGGSQDQVGHCQGPLGTVRSRSLESSELPRTSGLVPSFENVNPQQHGRPARTQLSCRRATTLKVVHDPSGLSSTAARRPVFGLQKGAYPGSLTLDSSRRRQAAEEVGRGTLPATRAIRPRKYTCDTSTRIGSSYVAAAYTVWVRRYMNEEQEP